MANLDKGGLIKVPVHYQEVKTSGKVLNIYESPDSWFWVNASINPYRGCEHNCRYCDGKAEWYRLDNFNSQIRVKTDSQRYFEKELLSLGYIPKERPALDQYISSTNSEERIPQKILTLFAIGGGVCDVYQQAEKRFKITRKLLKVAYRFRVPISILTKSALVLRDLELIKKIHAQSYANVSLSITLMDDEIRKIFEPKSHSIDDRFSTLQTIRKNEIPGGIMLMPILPGVGDTEGNLKNIVMKGKEIGTKFVLPAGLTLKPGRNKREMLTTIQNHYPQLGNLYKDLYSNDNKYGMPRKDVDYLNNGVKFVHELCFKNKIPDRIPRYLPPYVIKINYVVSTILFNLTYYYQYVREQSWKKYVDYAKIGRMIEQSSQSVSSLSKTKLKSLISNDLVFEVVEEVLQTGVSSELSQFQHPETIFEGKLSGEALLS